MISLDSKNMCLLLHYNNTSSAPQSSTESLHGIRNETPLIQPNGGDLLSLSLSLSIQPRLSGSASQHLGLPATMPKSKRNTTVSTLMFHVLEPAREIGDAAQAKAEAAQECSNTNCEEVSVY
jgi:hypothetical protein